MLFRSSWISQKHSASVRLAPDVAELVTDFGCETESGFIGVVVSPKAYLAAAIELRTCRQGDDGCNQGQK